MAACDDTSRGCGACDALGLYPSLNASIYRRHGRHLRMIAGMQAPLVENRPCRVIGAIRDRLLLFRCLKVLLSPWSDLKVISSLYDNIQYLHMTDVHVSSGRVSQTPCGKGSRVCVANKLCKRGDVTQKTQTGFFILHLRHEKY